MWGGRGSQQTVVLSIGGLEQALVFSGVGHTRAQLNQLATYATLTGASGLSCMMSSVGALVPMVDRIIPYEIIRKGRGSIQKIERATARSCAASVRIVKRGPKMKSGKK